MTDVQIRKGELLGIVRENRDKHKKEFAQTYLDYRVVLLHTLEEMLTGAKEDDQFHPEFQLRQPENYLESYNCAIRMLELETRDIVELTEYEFQNLVLDNWEWKHRFSATSLGYSSSSASIASMSTRA